LSNDEILRKFWEAKELDENEKFLRNYLLNKEYVQHDHQEKIDEEIDRQDDDILNKQEDFEEQYNHRFEEPGADTIITFPRNIPSVRKDPKAEKRKERRNRRLENKDTKKVKKAEELKKLKNEKKKQILEKMMEIQKLTGHNDFGFDMEKDYDTKTFDKAMLNMYADASENGTEETNDEVSEVKKQLDKILEEYYNLDFEDLIGGEIPTRFKYIEVEKDDFGLSVEQVLRTNETELNEIVPISSLAPYKTKDRRKRAKIDEPKKKKSSEKGAGRGKGNYLKWESKKSFIDHQNAKRKFGERRKQ